MPIELRLTQPTVVRPDGTAVATVPSNLLYLMRSRPYRPSSSMPTPPSQSACTKLPSTRRRPSGIGSSFRIKTR